MSFTTTPPTPPSAPSGNSLGAQARSLVGGMVPRLLALAVVLGLSYAGYWFFVVHKNTEAVADSLVEPGQCFSWTDEGGATELPCADDAAVYKSEGTETGDLTDSSVGDGCDALGAYVTFDISAVAGSDSQRGVICGVLNLAEGDCFSDGADPVIAACGDPVATAKVLSVQTVSSQADALSDDKASKLCGADATEYLSDAVGKAIVCVGDAE